MQPTDIYSGLDAKTLREHLSYDCDTGHFHWLKPTARNIKVGSLAGRLMDCGYWQITLNRKGYMAHRLAWLHTYGHWPAKRIDHINRNRSDNRIVNLRDVSSAENSWNAALLASNKSGAPGVIWRECYQRWQASIKRKGKMHFLGNFADFEAAAAARRAAELRDW